MSVCSFDMADHKEFAFDKIMEIVGNDGKFQKVFNHFYNVGLVCFASMAFMNIVLVLNEPDHNCRVPGRENFSLSESEWRNLTLPLEKDNRGFESLSACKMYNISKQLNKPVDEWKFTENDTINCIHGYDYDKTWYLKTAVSDEDWVCEKKLYQTNTFVFHRIGEAFGTFVFGQLGDTIGRRPVFYLSVVLIVLGRVASILTTSHYFLFAGSAVTSMLTSLSIIFCPLVIAIETSRAEDRALISMMQWVGWSVGLCTMPLIFWAVGDWIWFLMLTTLPLGLFALYPKYMIESPRWLATKRKFKECAQELNRIAKINGKQVKVTDKMLEELLPDVKVEEVYGMASLFNGWSIARNTTLLILCWSCVILTFFTLLLNSTRMGGNPFLSFFFQSAIELPGYILGRWICDRIGRRFTNVCFYLLIATTCIPIIGIVQYSQYERITSVLVVFLKFCNTVLFFSVHLQVMEIYPTCLRQSGLSIVTIGANALAALGPYIIYFGTEYDVRIPYAILSAICFIGSCCALFVPETLHHALPNTLQEARNFGEHQEFWSLPKRPIVRNDEELAEIQKLNNSCHE